MDVHWPLGYQLVSQLRRVPRVQQQRLKESTTVIIKYPEFIWRAVVALW